MNVVFLHPDLGLGGAERLVVDAASCLSALGHRVVILTGHHDPARAFPETVDGRLDVRVRGTWIPAQVFQHLRAPGAIARMAWLARTAARLEVRPDVVFCDLVAHAIPLLRRLQKAPVVFYCHYPDRLLTPPRRGLYRWYRVPIDALEEHGTGRADRVLVNSAFTAAQLRRTFPRLRTLAPTVVHPGVDCSTAPPLAAEPGSPTILSLARFDARKNVGLAVDALALLRERLAPAVFRDVRLVIAGGYDERLREQRETLQAIERRVRDHGLSDRVAVRRSPSEGERTALLAECRCVVYPPEGEHFGYVPLEAMAAARPVVAVRDGGPAETIVDGVTGLLCAPTAEAFATALGGLVTDPIAAARMGSAGRDHVTRHFSRDAFGRRLEAILRQVVESRA